MDPIQLDPCIDESPHLFSAIAVPPRNEFNEYTVEVYCTRCGKLRVDLDPARRVRNRERFEAMKRSFTGGVL